MPEPVAVDTATLKALMERLTRTADELAVLPIASLEALPGSALGDLDAPLRVATEVRRLGAAVQDWVCSARRSVDELADADSSGTERFPPR
ncbi:hypothetical protein [Mycolicibacterium sarraceniae]|uniref:ESX-1 secretion-associated protein n=1 Tax=Mycolicibacterium sarraceniae TaxID=1534348 RepID=A0A7I7SWT1_9MYCO|nr:hypothetical protein [Mycolicibacterium sarraceniae]BBY61090.1 hypothetical protein MSAR_42260 [Mycolicibacterium sarraceniae]